MPLASWSCSAELRKHGATPLALTAWRTQFHQHGGAELTGLTIQKLDDGKSVTLPVFTDQAVIDTELGQFQLTGYSRRGKFPVLEKRGELHRGEKPGQWNIKDAKGADFTSSTKALKFHTQGQTDFTPAWDWAPVLTFEPKVAGAYKITGQLNLLSGPASDKNESRTMRWMALILSGAKTGSAPGELRCYRLLSSYDGTSPAEPGKTYDPKPVASLLLDQVHAGKKQTVNLEHLGPALASWLANEENAMGLLLSVEPPQKSVALAPRVVVLAKEIKAQIAIRKHEPAQLYEQPLRPTDGVYAQVKNGKLYYGNQRLRLWGVVGYPDAGRLVRMGFNAQRVWNPREKDMYDAASAKLGQVRPYVKGDESNWDKADKQLADLRRVGCFVMLAALQNMIPPEHVLSDDSFVAGGEDWEEWKLAMSVKNKDTSRWVLFDERLRKLRWAHAKNLLTHVNPYTGKAIGQEEAIVIYEVFNENGAAKRLLEGGFENWPDYFKNKFRARWNQFLVTKYKTDDALLKAWGKVNDGESLANQSVAPGPVFEKRNDYPAARASDFVQFVLTLVDSFNQDFRSYCRTLAPPGVGVNVTPFSFDTQYRPSLAWSYIQGRGDVNCPGMYFWDLESSLGKPPSAYVIDSNTIEGCATVLYETNISRPNPHRAEYPFKLVALASWQDWDGIIWHYWSPGGKDIDAAYLSEPLPHLTTTHYWTGVHHQNDPVMCTSMALAGQMFMRERIQPAKSSNVITVGSQALHSYDYHNGIGQAQQTFELGSKIRYDPHVMSGATLKGEALPEPQRITSAVAAGDEVVYDWPNARLIIDTPTTKAYAGKIAGPYQFKDGIVLSDVGTDWVSFAMVSDDGKPLVGADASKRILVNAVFNAKNTGFDFDWNVKGCPVDQARAIRNRGRTPVLVDEVPYSVWFPTTIEGQTQSYDFALRSVNQRTVTQTNRITHTGPTAYMTVITLKSRGRSAPTPQPVKIVADTHAMTGNAGSHENRYSKSVADPRWNPIPNLSWGDDYHAAHKVLRDSTFTFTSITKEDLTDAADKTILHSDVKLNALWMGLADIEVIFSKDRMSRIVVTFKAPPPLSEVIASYEKRFGTAEQKTIASQYETSLARWKATEQRPSVLVTESQGILKILYEVKGSP